MTANSSLPLFEESPGSRDVVGHLCRPRSGAGVREDADINIFVYTSSDGSGLRIDSGAQSLSFVAFAVRPRRRAKRKQRENGPMLA
jgi:hypothetical protein